MTAEKERSMETHGFTIICATLSALFLDLINSLAKECDIVSLPNRQARFLVKLL